MGNYTARKRKPRIEFPLWIRKGGTKGKPRWCKKVNGKFLYFGYVADDPHGEAALKLWGEQAEDLRAGRVPRRRGSDYVSVALLCDRFVVSKDRRLEANEITKRTRNACKATCDFLVAELGKTRAVDDLRPEDFEALRAKLAKRNGPVRLGCEVTRIRSVFRYGVESGLLERAVRFGSEFHRPSKKVMRLNRATRGSRMLSPVELLKLIDGAKPQLKAMILLGINAAFGNADCGTLPLSAVDLDGGFITYPRPKTGIGRRCPLWRETADALREVIDKRRRPTTANTATLVFVTRFGHAWTRDSIANQITRAFKRQAEVVGVYRQGVSFYSLRHVFRTIVDGAKDTPAIRCIMGHGSGGHVEGDYIERLPDDERLIAVTEHVHRWLYEKPQTSSKLGVVSA